MIFGRNKRRKPQLDTLIGPHTEVIGDLRFSGGVHIDGKVKGNVSAAGDSAVLSVGAHGVVDGDVRAPIVVLNGIVHGDVHAEVKLTMSPKSRVVGNVHYTVIEMESGASVHGQLIRKGQPTAELRPPNSAAPPASKLSRNME